MSGDVAASGDDASPPFGPRRAARLSAVQALYQYALTGTPAPKLIDEFLVHRARDGSAHLPEREGAVGFFRMLVSETVHRLPALDQAIAARLQKGWTLARLENIVLAILRVATTELMGHPDIPAGAIISEYLAIADSFLGDREAGFINGVLDGIARDIRPIEMDAARKPSPPG